MELFSIQCTTCRSRLKVNDESVIGQILACPKCASMVQVVPPPEWRRSEAVLAAPQVLEVATPLSKTSSSKSSLAQTPANKTPASQAPANKTPPSRTPAVQPTPAAQAPAPRPSQVAAAAVPPALPVREPVSAAADTSANAGLARATTKWKQDGLVWGGGLLSGVVLGAGLWWFVSGMTAPVEVTAYRPTPSVTPADDPQTASSAPAVPAAEEAAAEAPEQAVSPAAPQPVEASDVAPAPDVAAAPAAIADTKQVPTETAASAPKSAKGAIKLEPAASAPAGPHVDARPQAEAQTSVQAPLAEPPAVARRIPEVAPAAQSMSAAEVDERLAHRLVQVEFTGVSLGQFVEFISEFSGLPMTLDDRALEKVGRGRQTPVTVRLNDVTAREALETVLKKLDLAWELRGAKLVVTTERAKAKRDTR